MDKVCANINNNNTTHQLSNTQYRYNKLSYHVSRNPAKLEYRSIFHSDVTLIPPKQYHVVLQTNATSQNAYLFWFSFHRNHSLPWNGKTLL